MGLPFVNKFYGDVLGQCWWNQFYMLYDFSGYPGFLVLSNYFRKHVNWSRSKRLSIGPVVLVVGWVVIVLSFYLQAKSGESLLISDLEIAWCLCIINCVIATTGPFLIISTITLGSGKIYAIVESILK